MLWFKAFHIIFVVCWFAGIFYLPRLFVYHAMNENTEVRAQLAVMERKLFRFVTPFAVLTVVFGLAMVGTQPGYYLHSVWFWLKMGLVALLIAYHVYCGVIVKRLAHGDIRRSHVFYRVFNEIPVLFLFAIVLLVVLKPSF